MFKRSLLALFASVSLAAACGPSGNNPDAGPAGDSSVPDLPDEDGDGIADIHEGREADVDTDDDGIADYLDDDSDGDGIPDYREAGDELSGTPPYDSDGDGTPDFRDLDSDENGIGDGVGPGYDTIDDPDGDGIGNFADLDDDGDMMPDPFEIGDDPGNPIDTDNDGTPDFQDIDSDGDTIQDAHERAEDPDQDGIPAFRDLDSDEDCIADAAEAGDADLASPPIDTDGDTRPDFLDLDKDNDGLLDAAEDANCNGIQDGGETSAINEDSDNDGVSDLIEDAAGTDPLDDQDNPQANGDFVFVVPYQELPSPDKDDLDFSTDLKMVDLYVLIDRSGSMSTEISSVKSNLQTVLSELTCAPLGSGAPGDCIPDLWSGGGSLTYSDLLPYQNHLDVQSNPAMVGSALPGANDDSTNPSDTYDEAMYAALRSTVTGEGSSSLSCTGLASYSAKGACANGGIGYPCFRPNALPVILLATDEPPSATFTCPGLNSATTQANAIGAKVIGIKGSTTSTAVQNDLEAIASGTGAVDGSNNPLVFAGANAGAANAIKTAVQTLASSVPLDISARTADDPSDAVDAVAEFVDHLETLQLGSAECADGLTEQDSNSDGFADLYIDVQPGTPVCWRLIPKQNTTIMPTTDPQLFKATIQVYGDNVTLLDTRDVYFLVPPANQDIPVD